MAQSDYELAAHISGLNQRTEINSIFDSILTHNSGSTAPTVTKAFMMWVDTSNATYYYLKMRNHDNTAWVTLFIYTVSTKVITPFIINSPTTNAIPKINADGTIGNSNIIIDDNGNVRVTSGTTWNNGGGLEASYSANNGYLTTYLDADSLTLGSGVSYKNRIKINGSGLTNDIEFYTGGSKRLTIDGNGNSFTQGSITANDGRSIITYASGHVQFIGLNANTVFGTTGAYATRIYTNGSERVIIDSNGNVGISSGSLLLTSGTGALGYGTGAGGTVTQLTSKSTAVTLNKPSGIITMNSSALAAGARVSFQLVNSSISIYDTLVCNLLGISYLDGYSITCVGTGNGYAHFNLKNNTASNLSDNVQFGFSVVKGATA